MHRREFMKFAAASAVLSAMAGGVGAAETSAGAAAAGPASQSQTESQGGPMALSIRKPMVGFMLGHEQFPVPELVQLGVLAEQAGFDLLATSDHFQPWQSNEGHAGEAWITMTALGERTRKVWIGPTVTCPTFRYSPAVVAEA